MIRTHICSNAHTVFHVYDATWYAHCFPTIELRHNNYDYG